MGTMGFTGAGAVVMGAVVATDVVCVEVVVTPRLLVEVTLEAVVVELLEDNQAIRPITTPMSTTRPTNCFNLIFLFICFVCLATFSWR